MEIKNLKDKYLEDLNYFLEYADSPRGKENDEPFPQESFHLNFYLNHTNKELENYINKFLEKNEVNNDYDFYYFLNCIIKYMSSSSDSHTMIYKEDNTWFPIRFKIINNKVFIDRCFDKKMLRKEIKSINGIDIDRVVTEIESCTSYGTNSWLLSSIEKMLSNKNDLLSLPSIQSQNDKIVFETADNELISFDIKDNYNEQIIYPQNNMKQYKIDNDILIFKYPSCRNEYEPDISKIKEIIGDNAIRKFVLDLRGNSGGNSEIIKPLIEYLSEKDLELYTIVDRNVFSSGRFATIDMKRIGSKIVGEQIGTPINCFGYVSGNGITPNSKINFNFARVYWYEDKGFMEGKYTKEELNKKNKEFFEPKHLTIDIPVEINEEEYISSLEDVFLNKSLELVKSNKHKKVKS